MLHHAQYQPSDLACWVRYLVLFLTIHLTGSDNYHRTKWFSSYTFIHTRAHYLFPISSENMFSSLMTQFKFQNQSMKLKYKTKILMTSPKTSKPTNLQAYTAKTICHPNSSPAWDLLSISFSIHNMILQDRSNIVSYFDSYAMCPFTPDLRSLHGQDHGRLWYSIEQSKHGVKRRQFFHLDIHDSCKRKRASGTYLNHSWIIQNTDKSPRQYSSKTLTYLAKSDSIVTMAMS